MKAAVASSIGELMLAICNCLCLLVQQISIPEATDQNVQKALQADQVVTQQAPTMAPPASQPTIPEAPSPYAEQLRVQRSGASLLNPAISGILDGYFGYYWRPSDFLAAGLPPTEEDPGFDKQGFGIQETELSFQAAIDAYLEASLFLTNPNLEGFAVEEGYVVTSALPANLQAKVGILRSQVGRNNEQHLHVQQFTRRPLLTTLLFGRDGLRAPGAQVSVLLPMPWFATIYAEIFSIGPPEDPALRQRIATFGGGDRSDARNIVAAAILEQYRDPTVNSSLLLGLNFATGRSFAPCAMAACAAGPRDYLYGADLYFKWQPPNVADTHAAFQWTTEFFARTLGGDGPTEGAFYTEPVLKFARRWHGGIRLDLTGLPDGSNLPRRYGLSGAITFEPSEFSLVRAYIQEISGPAISKSTVAFLQFQFAMGAHGAHPF